MNQEVRTMVSTKQSASLSKPKRHPRHSFSTAKPHNESTSDEKKECCGCGGLNCDKKKDKSDNSSKLTGNLDWWTVHTQNQDILIFIYLLLFRVKR